MARVRHVALPRNAAEVERAARESNHADSGISEVLVTASRSEPAAVIASLGSTADGLTDDQAQSIRARVGLNVIETAKPPALWRMIFDSVRSPFVLLLIVLGVVLLATGDTASASTIAVMVAIAVGMQVSQEYRANASAQALKSMVVARATVRRRSADGTLQASDIPAPQVVPGDIVVLKAGDLIPADLRVIHVKDLTLSQSSLTGESTPQDKVPIALDTTDADLLRAHNVCFMGTSVLSGTGEAVVVETGPRTYFGAMAHTIETVTGQSTYDASIRQVSLLLVRLMVVLAPLVLVLNGWHTGDWLGAVFFAVAVAVGLTPSMLPTIVSANLARGSSFMAHKKVIVKVPDAIQNLGSMDILCTDKTGTLTEDRIVLERHLDMDGRDSEFALFAGYLNSEHHTGVRNTLDAAVIASYGDQNAARVAGHLRVVDEIPFDFERRRLSVVLDRAPRAALVEPGPELARLFPDGRLLEANEDLLLTKGAFPEVLSVCDRVISDDQVVDLDDARLAKLRATVAAENERGMRVLAVATKIIAPDDARARLVDGVYQYGVADESGMLLVGLLTFLDPPKESAAAAIADLRVNGVGVRVISGDSAPVTEYVVDQVGIWGDVPTAEHSARSMTGADVDALDDAALSKKSENTLVFAEMSPLQKARVVKALQASGHAVGYMGDGINDAPPLRQADVGISVEDGVDIAKETADIILLEQDLRVLENGVLEGRRTFGNIQKYLKMTVASNFGNVISVLVASIFIPFIPMLAIQLLVQNLLYDICQTAIPWDTVDKEFVARPRRWSAGNLPRFMLWMGPLSSVFDVAIFAVMWVVFGAVGFTPAGVADPASQHLFQTGWFVVGLVTQVLVVHMVRTEKIPFVQSTASRPVILASLATVALAIALPYTPLAGAFDFVPLPAAYFAWFALIVGGYCVATQLVKVVYIRRYHEWL